MISEQIHIIDSYNQYNLYSASAYVYVCVGQDQPSMRPRAEKTLGDEAAIEAIEAWEAVQEVSAAQKEA
jgi:hypothetical protein